MRADNNNSVSTSPAHSFLLYLVIVFFKLQTLGLWESAFSYKNAFCFFWWGKESLKTCHPAELQNYKSKKKNLKSALVLNICIFNSDFMTSRKVLLLGFKWGKKFTLTTVCSLNKVLKEILASATGQKKTWITAKWLLCEIFCALSFLYFQLELETQQT